jgi:rhodanese-related sulfurtransferase
VVREITSQDAWDAFRLHLPFLDARRTADFAEGHVPGAWSVPVWEAQPEAAITAFEASANPGSRDPIVLYCSGGGCEDARLLANRLVALGYRNLLLYAGGFPDWTAKARPVATGARP